MNEGKGREEEEPGIKLLPVPGLLASSAWGGGPVCQASLGQNKLGEAGV